ncbi:MAG: DNA-binding protein [Proteobacteria bacterium HN_bin10]|jgi:DNA-binding protein HU-beta|nr:MAG: DNA-binding protein [Proteobacteria bacterium HN_bin10]
MNKAEFVADVSERIGESKQRGEEVVNAVFEALTSALRRGDEVRLPQFGVFLVSQTKERKARNPQTGEEVLVPAGKRPKFRPGKALKEALG